MPKLKKSKCIKAYCLECSGNSPKEVTFCNLLDCPLWPFRTGSYITTLLYRSRIEKAFRNHPHEVADLETMGLKEEDFLRPPAWEESDPPEVDGPDEDGEDDSCTLMT